MFAILDIETTGGKFDNESITEIAIIQYDGNKIIDKFSSLINPGKKIDPFVEKLTGINKRMLRNAPKFYNIAKRIVKITEKCIIVAHNADFDYRVLKTEFRRLGYDFKRKTICTFKLSIKLFPNKISYNLGKLVKSLGIPIKKSHRAYEDANATFKLFRLLQEKDVNKTILTNEIKNSHLNLLSKNILNLIDKIPSKTGLYYFYNNKNKLIFIGSSSNLKKKVFNHFLNNTSRNRFYKNEINNISFSLTGNESIAILKKRNEIISNAPICNNKNDSLKKYNPNNKLNEPLYYPFDNFLLVDKGRNQDEFSFIFIKNKIYKGYGFFDLNHQIKDEVNINSRLIEMSEDKEMKRFIIKLIKNKKFKKIIPIDLDCKIHLK